MDTQGSIEIPVLTWDAPDIGIRPVTKYQIRPDIWPNMLLLVFNNGSLAGRHSFLILILICSSFINNNNFFVIKSWLSDRLHTGYPANRSPLHP